MRPTNQPLGVAAITPSRTPQSLTEPTFTADDVVTYLGLHPARSAGNVGSKQSATIERIEFLSARDVKDRLNTWIGVPDDAPLCLVTLRGTFMAGSLPRIAPIQGNRAWRVFDARSGNILLEGVGLHLEEDQALP